LHGLKHLGEKIPLRTGGKTGNILQHLKRRDVRGINRHHGKVGRTGKKLNGPLELEQFAQNRKGGLQAEGGVGNGSLQHLKLILCDHLVQRCHLFHILFLFLIQIKILPGSIPAFVFLFLFILCSRPEKMTEGGKKHMIRGRKKKETAGKWMEKKQQKENRYSKGMPFMK